MSTHTHSLVFYFTARDDPAALSASGTIRSILSLLRESVAASGTTCYVGIDGTGRHAAPSTKNEDARFFPSNDWRAYRLTRSRKNDTSDILYTPLTTESYLPETIANGFEHYLSLVAKDLAANASHEPRRIVLSLSGHGNPIYGFTASQFMKVAKLLGDEKQVPSRVFRVVDDLITDLARDKGIDRVDQRLKEIGLPEFFSNGTSVGTVREGLLNLRLTLRSPEWFFSLGAGTLVSSLRFGFAKTTPDATKQDNGDRPENDSMSVRAFGGLVKKYFAGAKMPLLVMLHNCSLGLLEVFFELREVGRNVIAANTTIGGHLSPQLWLRDGGSMSEDHEWCQNVLKLERKGNSFRRFVGIGNNPKAWESLVERMVDVVNQLENVRACDEWASLRTSCPVPGSNVDSLVVMDDVIAVMRRLRPCVDDSGFDKIVSRLLLARTAPNEIWPAIYFPTCGLHPHKYYSNPKEAGEGNGFEFLDRVRWGELLRK